MHIYLFLLSVIDPKDSQAMFFEAIEKTLIHDRRKLKILRWDEKENFIVSERFVAEVYFISLF